MLNRIKFFEFVISIESIIISTMLPVYILIPFKNRLELVDLPTNWQVPAIIFLTIIFSRKLILKAYTIFLLLGIFVLPLFYDGGSLGYILTPNFGYILGLFPLIQITDYLNIKKELSISGILGTGTLAISSMHLTGIIYMSLLFLVFNKIDLIAYNIGVFTISKIFIHIFNKVKFQC